LSPVALNFSLLLSSLIDLVESSENAFFQWEEPMFLIKLAKLKDE
jgi:hypothetical protein